MSASPAKANPRGPRGRSWSTVVWVLTLLAVGVVGVILAWHSKGGTPDPSQPGTHMSHTTAVIDSAILVFREGLETILVLAAITASFLGGNKVYRRPVALGGSLAILATIGTWFVAIWFIGMFGNNGLSVQAATGIPAIIVLLLVMNWFFHKVYWTGWISHHHKRRRGLLPTPGETPTRAMLLGLGLLGFTSVYREGFEIVIFLQGLRVTQGSSVVLEGVVLGAMFTAAVGAFTFVLHEKLPYKRLLIITGAMLVVVLFVMVGEEINEMQLAGWIGTSNISWLHFPGWAGTWFSLFANWQTIVAQIVSVAVVLGSYAAAQYVRVWRPKRRGGAVAEVAVRPPSEPVAAPSRTSALQA
jgi:high-affinity iron transporter